MLETPKRNKSVYIARKISAIDVMIVKKCRPWPDAASETLRLVWVYTFCICSKVPFRMKLAICFMFCDSSVVLYLFTSILLCYSGVCLLCRLHILHGLIFTLIFASIYTKYLFAIFKNVVHSSEPAGTPNNSASHRDPNSVQRSQNIAKTF